MVRELRWWGTRNLAILKQFAGPKNSSVPQEAAKNACPNVNKMQLHNLLRQTWWFYHVLSIFNPVHHVHPPKWSCCLFYMGDILNLLRYINSQPLTPSLTGYVLPCFNHHQPSFCSIQFGMSSSQLTFIFFRGVGQPPTSQDLVNRH